jgi:F-type H+-transporting ATPase subunit a
MQNLLEMIIEALHGLTDTITESAARTKAIFPFVLSFFTFILLNNWLGLLPGVGTIGFREPAEEGHKAAQMNQSPWITAVNASGPAKEAENATVETSAEVKEETPSEGVFVPYFRAGTADLNTTVAFALISVLATQIIGIKFLGISYFKKFFNLKGPIDAFVGILELVSEVSKVISFAFRLFGNVFAGEVLLAVMYFLMPLLVPVPFIALEIFVGAIQAFVFAMLSLVFMNMATHGHDNEAHA